MSEDSDPPARPRKRWRRRLGILFLILIAVGFWANGPGARWAIESYLPGILEKQNLSGDFSVSGSLLNGIALEDVSLEGDYLIQKVEARKVALSWSLSSLLSKHPEGIEVQSLALQLDFDSPKPPGEAPAEEEATDPAPLSDTLDLVRGIIGPAEISITDLKLDAKVTELNFNLTLDSLTHIPGEDSYLIQQLTLTDHLKRVATNPKTMINWDHENITVDQLQILKDLGVRDLVFRIEGGLNGDLLIADSKISATSNLGKEFTFTLDSPSLKIKKLASLYDPEIPAGGSITKLSLTPNRLQLQGDNIQWKDQSIQYLDLDGTLDGQQVEASLDVVYQGDRISLDASGRNGFEVMDNETTVRLNFRDQLTANGIVILNKDPLQSQARLAFDLTYPEVPKVSGTIALADKKVELSGKALDGLNLNAGFDIETSSYTADLTGDLEDGSPLHEKLKGPLSLTAKASGRLPDQIHRGSLDLKKVNLADPQLSASAQATWDWPQKVSVTNLQVDAPEGQVTGDLAWEDDFLTVDSLKIIESGSVLFSAEGNLPAPLDTRSLDDVLENEAPFDFTLKSQPLSFNRLRKFAPIPTTLKGVFEADLKLTGTLANPQLDGMAALIDFYQTDQPKIPSADLRTTFRTEDQQLFINGNAREPGGPLLDIEGSIAFLPAVWLKREKSPNDAKIDLLVQSPDLNLKRIQPFAPSIRTLTGSLKTNVKVSGTLAKPQIFGELTAGIDRMILDDSPIADFRDSRFRVSFKDQIITIHPSSLMAAGGSLNLGGSISIAGDEPNFDLSLSGRYILLTRNQDYTFRGHPDLKLRGPLSRATLSGSLAIAESLIYKDVEILPFGVPRTTDIPRPNLPSFSSRSPSTGSSLLVPEPYGNWPLDISVTTADPILIRGNLAKGNLTANARILGTIGAPRPSGTIQSTELTADLPFSNLEVSSAVITLRPDDYDNPVISLRGFSKVSQYTVQVFLSGPVSNPNLTLSSNPPLPENEIMLLIATGSPSASLEDRQVASQKALQYLLEGLRRRYGNKDKSVLQRLLKNSDQIQLSLGDTNQFTGRKFSSATLEIADQWDFTTQIDEQGQTRALVIFSIRFK